VVVVLKDGLTASLADEEVRLRMSLSGALAQAFVRLRIDSSAVATDTSKGIEEGAAAADVERAGANAGTRTATAFNKTFKAGLLGVVGSAAVAAAAIKSAVDFQTEMTKIQTQAGASAAQVKQLSAAVLQLAPSTEQGPMQLAEALYHNEAVPFTLAQIDALSWALRHTARCREDCARCQPNRFDILPRLGMNTGMRQGELFGLAVGDIDFLRRVITVRRQVKLINGVQAFADIKNDKVHQVPVTGWLCNLIARYMQLFPPVAVTLSLEEDGELKDKTATHTLLLTRPGELAMHREGVNGRWKSGLKRAGIEVERKRMMHALRHTAVSVWLSRGISTKAVAEFIGDTEHTVISTYSHLMPDDRDKARRAMEDFMNGPAEDPSQAAPEGSALKIVP
jgi:integrase